MIPSPKMSDVFMDLIADSTEFLDGKAHRGMALGSNNIYERCKDAILKGNVNLKCIVTVMIINANNCMFMQI